MDIMKGDESILVEGEDREKVREGLRALGNGGRGILKVGEPVPRRGVPMGE